MGYNPTRISQLFVEYAYLQSPGRIRLAEALGN